MKYINMAMNCCVNTDCKCRIISEKITKKCPICESKTRKEKKFIARVVTKNDEGFIILREKGKQVNDSNKRTTAKNKKRTLPGYARGFGKPDCELGK